MKDKIALKHLFSASVNVILNTSYYTFDNYMSDISTICKHCYFLYWQQARLQNICQAKQF